MARFLAKRDRTVEGVRRTRETWFGRVAQLFQGGQVDGVVWEELEEALLSADVGVSTTQALLERARTRLRETGGKALEVVKREMEAQFREPRSALTRLLEHGEGRPKPMVVLVVGVNGSGKTTAIARLAHYYQGGGDRVILGAADTFRAAAIEQLQAWGRRVGAEVVANRPGSDPAAVAYDTLQAGKARGADVVIIDTAGRLHNNSNLMEELRKIRKVLQRLDESAPHLMVLVLDATTGQNGLVQARAFTEAVACDGIFLAKLDGTAKGGMLFAIQKELGLPVLFIGTGEQEDDLSPFDSHQFVEALFAPAPARPRT